MFNYLCSYMTSLEMLTMAKTLVNNITLQQLVSLQKQLFLLLFQHAHYVWNFKFILGSIIYLLESQGVTLRSLWPCPDPRC